jgi:hypothetical protein
VNQRVVVAVRGAKKLPAAKPSSTPNKSWNWPRVAAWLASTRPRPRRPPPRRTTPRVPSRSERAPQKNDPAPIQRKFRSAAVEMPARDQPIASEMGWRKTPSVKTAPSPMQVTTMPTPTMTQP